MNNIESIFEKNKPNISKSSIKTYTSIIRSVCKKTGLNVDELSSNVDKIVDTYKDLKQSSRKTIYATLYVYTENKKFQTLMVDDSNASSITASKHEKTEAQEASWINKEQIETIYNEHKQQANLCYKKGTLTMADLQTIQQYIIICLLGGIFIAPRRLLDYTEFKIKNIDKSADNYLDKSNLIFNAYKTKKYYNQQSVECPKELKTILTKWIKNNPNDYLLFDANGNKLTSVKLNQRLVKVFGNKTSVNIMRHVYLTDKFGDEIERQKKMDKVASDMGTSSSQVVGTYIKKE
jgi:hypothetical protein